jgi:uncharacterized protein YbjQ (UPF0145 family)
MRESIFVGAVLMLGGCGDSPAYTSAYPTPPPIRYETRVEVHSDRRVVVSSAQAAPGEWPAEMQVGDVFITTSRTVSRATEVVGVIDAHEPSGRQDAAFALIRARANALGADAVLGVEFHHGEGEGEPTHLSGLAVRYVDRNR